MAAAQEGPSVEEAEKEMGQEVLVGNSQATPENGQEEGLVATKQVERSEKELVYGY